MKLKSVAIALFVLMGYGTAGTIRISGRGKTVESVRSFAAKQMGVEPADVNIKELRNPYFKKWKFWRVSDRDMPPRSVMLVSSGERVRPISLGDGFRELVAEEPVKTASSQEAIAYVRFFLSVSAPHLNILERVDDIPGLSHAEKQTWSEKIRAPSARPQPTGYLVELWAWNAGQLLGIQCSVDQEGGITTETTTRAKRVGVPISIE